MVLSLDVIPVKTIFFSSWNIVGLFTDLQLTNIDNLIYEDS